MRRLQERGPVAALSGAPGPRPSEPGPRPGGTGPGSAAPVRPPRLRRLSIALGVGGGVVVVDQVTKSLAVARLHGPVHLWGPLGLGLGYNSGSAFSLFTGRAPVLAPLAVVIVGVLLWLAWRASSSALAVALGLVLGGALGNVADRVLRNHRGGVVDFITLTHWPTFNVADLCITVGAVLLAVLIVRQPRMWSQPGSGSGPRTGSHERQADDGR